MKNHRRVHCGKYKRKDHAPPWPRFKRNSPKKFVLDTPRLTGSEELNQQGRIIRWLKLAAEKRGLQRCGRLALRSDLVLVVKHNCYLLRVASQLYHAACNPSCYWRVLAASRPPSATFSARAYPYLSDDRFIGNHFNDMILATWNLHDDVYSSLPTLNSYLHSILLIDKCFVLLDRSEW